MKLFNDNFQNFKRYNIPKAQPIICCEMEKRQMQLVL